MNEEIIKEKVARTFGVVLEREVRVITDKNVVIRDNRTLSGHESMPFFLSKGSMI